jgi:ubiquinone/menaquinone biosynthesis C-methylase UbiE
MGLPPDFLAGLKCADLGCGSAVHGTVNMLELGAGSVNAMDLDQSFIAPAERRLRERTSFNDRWQLDIGSLSALPYRDEHFDFVLCAGVIHHVVDDRRAVVEIHRIMKPGARAYLSVAGKGGLLNRFFMELLRDEWTHNPEFQKLAETDLLAEWLRQQVLDLKSMVDNDDEGSYNASIALLDSLSQLIDEDLILSIIDLVAAPIYRSYTEGEWFALLRAGGFHEYYRFTRRPQYRNLRKIVAPLCERTDHPLARLLYNTGYMNVVVTKSAS